MADAARDSKFWYLKHFNFFEGMDEETMKKVDTMSSMSTIKTQQPIYFPAEPSNSIYLLKKGRVKLLRVDEEGNEVIMDVLGPGEIFGELTFGEDSDEDREQSGEMAMALDDCLICTIRNEDFENLLRSFPELNFRITRRIGLRMRKFEERVTDLVFKDVKKRIATFLVKYAEEFGKVKKGVVTIKMHLSHQDIGLLTGAARQTVTTILNDFRSQGILDFSRKSMEIRDYEALQKEAG